MCFYRGKLSLQSLCSSARLLILALPNGGRTKCRSCISAPRGLRSLHQPRGAGSAQHAALPALSEPPLRVLSVLRGAVTSDASPLVLGGDTS